MSEGVPGGGDSGEGGSEDAGETVGGGLNGATTDPKTKICHIENKINRW